MNQQAFIAALEEQLQHCGREFSRAAVLEFVADVWPLAQDDPDPARWAREFLAAGWAEAGRAEMPA
jgi:hypothetical protein